MARYDVNDRVILITGGASGIGRESAIQLARRGARLALVDFDAEGVERAAAEIGEAAEPFVADVTDRESIGAATAAALEHFGGIDVAIASAGISGKPGPVTHIDDDDFERVIRTNVVGVWNTLKAAMPHVIERKGYLLPIASLAAAVPTPLGAPYGTSKHAVHGLARTMRFELAHTGVKVGVGYFSFIDTHMTDEAFAEGAAHESLRGIPERFSKPAPVWKAGAAIVRAIERRSKRACYPNWVGPVVVMQSLGGPLESLAARHPMLVKTWKRAVKEAEADTEPEKVSQ